MNSLKDYQEQFVAYLLDDPESATFEKNNKALTTNIAQDKMAIYRQSRLGRIIKVLRNTYPVCEGIVGENYFKQLCLHHAKYEIACESDITLYGKNFSLFLKQHVEQSLAYLPDVAQLEWACFSVLYGSQMFPLDVTKLSKVTEDTHSKLKFQLGATHILLSSIYPILEIWRQHAEPPEEHREIDLAEGGCQLLIYRRGWDLMVDVLTDEEYLFLSCFKQGKTFEQTWTLCENAFPNSPLTALFAKAVERGWVTDFHL